MKRPWEDDLREIMAEHDGVFGHNVEFDNPIGYFKRLEKAADLDCRIQILDYYSVRIQLPKRKSYGRENLLLFLLTEGPVPSEVRYSKKSDSITVDWHV